MWDLSRSALEAARYCGTALVLFGTFNRVQESVGQPQVNPRAQTSTVRCATVKSSFEEGKCILLSFKGEVYDGQAFERSFGEHLLFRLAPRGKQYGWYIEVVPEQAENHNHLEYVWVVTPPYHFWNPRYVDASYGMSATQAVGASRRDFNFVLNEEQFRKASDLVALAVSSHSLSDKRSQQELEREGQEAAEALFKFPVAKGRLTILESKIDDGDERVSQGYIKWLEFKVELRVPCDFAVREGAGEIVADRSQCPAERSPKGE
jgi:hypothetical protein